MSRIYDRNDTTAATTCHRCGVEIAGGTWLDDGGPLCSWCGQDVRVMNIKRNRERERRENMNTKIHFYKEPVTIRASIDTGGQSYWAKMSINNADLVVFTESRSLAREVLVSLRDEINRALAASLEDERAEDQSHCHDHVAGRQGEGR